MIGIGQVYPSMTDSVLSIQCTVLLMITTTLTIQEDGVDFEEKFVYLRKSPKPPLIGEPFQRHSY